jgi:hypothetical protein
MEALLRLAFRAFFLNKVSKSGYIPAGGYFQANRFQRADALDFQIVRKNYDFAV